MAAVSRAEEALIARVTSGEQVQVRTPNGQVLNIVDISRRADNDWKVLFGVCPAEHSFEFYELERLEVVEEAIDHGELIYGSGYDQLRIAEGKLRIYCGCADEDSEATEEVEECSYTDIELPASSIAILHTLHSIAAATGAHILVKDTPGILPIVRELPDAGEIVRVGDELISRRLGVRVPDGFESGQLLAEASVNLAVLVKRREEQDAANG